MADKSGVYKYYNGSGYDNIYFKTKASLVEQDEKHNFVSKDDIKLWNGKADKSKATEDKEGLMSKEDKIKLKNISEKANNYVHPSGSGSKHIPAGGKSGQVLTYNSDGEAKWVSPFYYAYHDENKTIIQVDGIDSKDKNIIELKYFCNNKTEVSQVYLEVNSREGGFILEDTAGGRVFMHLTFVRMPNNNWLVNWKCSFANCIDTYNTIWERSTIITHDEIKLIRIHTGGTGQVFERGRVLMKMY